LAVAVYAATAAVDVTLLTASTLPKRNAQDGAVTFSEVLIVNVMVSLALATLVRLSHPRGNVIDPFRILALAWLLEKIDTVCTTATVLSDCTDDESVTAVTATPAFPALSWNVTVNVTAPSVSPAATVYAQVQVLAAAFVLCTDGELLTAALPDWNTHVGVTIVSLAVRRRITIWPTLAWNGLIRLLEASETSVNKGGLATNTDVAPVTAVTTPPFPVRSRNVTVNVTAPSASATEPPVLTYAQVQVLPAVFTAVTIALTGCPPDRNTQVGEAMASLAMIVRVTVSFGVASVEFVLLEAMLTVGTVGAVVSTATDDESDTTVTATPVFPALSWNVTVNVTAPSVSPAATVYAQVHVFVDGLVFTELTLAVIGWLPDCSTQVGDTIVSLANSVSVTIWFAIARVGSTLLEVMPTEVKVGSVRSNVMDDESVTAVTAVPELPMLSW
jgi:hypothetical protein